MRSSQKKLSRAQEERVKLRLATLLADIRNPKEMQQFLESFLTESEHLALSKRISIIKKLSKGESYESIQQSLSVSSATISSTANFENEKVLSMIIEKLRIDEWAGNWAKKLLNIFR